MESRSFFVAGKFGAAQGIKGWVRVIAFTACEDDIFERGSWYICKKGLAGALAAGSSKGLPQLQSIQGFDADTAASQALELCKVSPVSWRDHSKGYAVELEGFTDRNQAQLLTNQFIYLPTDSLESLEGGDYYWRDLIGLHVFGVEGERIGTVLELMETGANDVLVVQSEKFGRVLVPYVPDQVIKSIDLQMRTMVLDWDFSDDA